MLETRAAHCLTALYSVEHKNEATSFFESASRRIDGEDERIVERLLFAKVDFGRQPGRREAPALVA